MDMDAWMTACCPKIKWFIQGQMWHLFVVPERKVGQVTNMSKRSALITSHAWEDRPWLLDFRSTSWGLAWIYFASGKISELNSSHCREVIGDWIQEDTAAQTSPPFGSISLGLLFKSPKQIQTLSPCPTLSNPPFPSILRSTSLAHRWLSSSWNPKNASLIALGEYTDFKAERTIMII